MIKIGSIRSGRSTVVATTAVIINPAEAEARDAIERLAAQMLRTGRYDQATAEAEARRLLGLDESA